MKNILVVLSLILCGCASVDRVGNDVKDVANTIPEAIGTVGAAAVFGGTVSMVPSPESHITNSVNRESRLIYNDSRRKFQSKITSIFE